ncbi:MAG TPA: hypothetical protein VLB80_02395 [Candidatus Babeliales bacterium]|nr:hypothetical protein [Candidatus Babeliales bacterium]
MRILTPLVVMMLNTAVHYGIAQEAPPINTSLEKPNEKSPTETTNTSIKQEGETTQQKEGLPKSHAKESTPALVKELPETSSEKPMNPSVTPVPIEPEPVEEEIVITEKPIGIDTVSLENPQGNWLFKRIWWERAEERYEKIRLLVDSIWESRTIFFVKRNELDRNILDPFYLNIGVGQGELQTILSELINFFEKKREQEGDLSEQERTLYESIATEEEAIKQLKLDVESIANLDHSIDDALGTLMNQINRVRQFEKQAWDNFKEIAHILNDTKARELYYMIEGAARNIKNISLYLEKDFLTHFNKLINEATQHITRVQNQIEALKEKGVNLKRRTSLLEQQTEQNQEEENQGDTNDEEEVAPKQKLSWFGWIASFIKKGLNAILSVIKIPYNMIFGK